MHDNLIMGVFVLVAAMIGFRFGIAVSIFEIAAGILAGNLLGVKPNDWLNHFAEFGSLLLIFLAGSDIDVDFMLRRLKPVALVGTISFLAPFLVVFAYGHFVAHWERDKLLLIAIASSSTSVAVVYPVLRDAGLLQVALGKLMLLVAFLPDFLITVALFVFFTKFGLDTVAVIAALVALILIIRHASFRFLRKFGETSSQLKLRFIFAILLFLAFVSEKGNLHASLAVFIMGIVVSELMKEQEDTDRNLRAVAFSIFVPTFYFKAGLMFSIPEVTKNWPMILLLIVLAFSAKFVGIYVLGRPYFAEHIRYASFLLNARLTFGTIAATYGITHGIIDQQYFSILISMIILSSAIALVFTGKTPRAVLEPTFAEHQ
jgi:Kef-type K+ transport system membrane component KefB